ncbi:MAG: hypothetical protein U1E28_21965 [Beijerinckiaceae bacterium]
MTQSAPTTTPAPSAGVRAPRAGRRLLSIEQALRWAFATELVNADGYGVEEPAEQHPMWKIRVDGGGGTWDALAVSRLVDSDALAIGDAVARLADVDLLPPADLGDEERRHFVANRGRATALVVTHAKLGTRPDIDVPVPGPIYAPNGRPVVRRLTQQTERIITGEKALYDREEIVTAPPARMRGSAGQYPPGSFCPLDWFPTFDACARDRAEESIWVAALAWLAAEIGDSLERIEIVAAARSSPIS